MNWIEGQPDKEGLYWVHDSINGVLFAMLVNIQEENVQGMYYYIMGCDMGFPVDQLTHFMPVQAPAAPLGVLPAGNFDVEVS